MKNKKSIFIVTILAPMLILSLITYVNIFKLPEKIYINEGNYDSTIKVSNSFFIKDSNSSKDELELKLLGFIPIKSIAVSKVKDLEVYPGGSNIGIKINTKGVLVVGHSDIDKDNARIESPAKTSGIELGDILTKINGEEIENSKDLSTKIKEVNQDKIEVEYIRNGITQSKEVNLIKEDDDYKLGLWVRDSTAGIGTLTFFDNNTKRFGALGHPITDGDTDKPFTISEGNLLNSSVISVRKGEKGSPGELKGLFVNEKDSLGTIEKNTETGIFGEGNDKLINTVFNKPLKVAFRNDIKEGPAKIITTIDENGPKLYDIEIIKLLPQDKPGPKSMVIKVTDEELLEKTGGIVQGMSGTPVIQDNKIVGGARAVVKSNKRIGVMTNIDYMIKNCNK